MLNPSFVKLAFKNRKKELQNWEAAMASAIFSDHIKEALQLSAKSMTCLEGPLYSAEMMK